jgi:hypothetical protein
MAPDMLVVINDGQAENFAQSFSVLADFFGKLKENERG